MAMKTGRVISLSLRVSPETKAGLAELAELLSESMGTRMTLSQALEVAISEAVLARRPGDWVV